MQAPQFSSCQGDIVVVDDEGITFQLLERILRSQGYRVRPISQTLTLK